MNQTPPNPPGNASVATTSPQTPKWRWSYSRLFGVMYGPIPVGIIVAVIVFAIYFATR